ncbi:MAG: Protein-tyrosine phosphatase, low molecular weight [Armatimonadetes bacterium]|jgi:arsenate reductase|nr:Protein-tyrosine phosphatase, low molecular weight [Armatimonadota bacterium]
MQPVLFVCVHNAGRSQMAEAFFNTLARERGLEVQALSAGTAPGGQVNPVAVQAMEELGISMAGQSPKLLTPELAASGRVITMGCGVQADMCPAGTYISEDWGLDDPMGKSLEGVRRVRDQIRERVAALVGDLASTQPAEGPGR